MKKTEVLFIIYAIIFVLIIGLAGFLIGYGCGYDKSASNSEKDIVISDTYDMEYVSRNDIIERIAKTPKATIMLIERR